MGLAVEQLRQEELRNKKLREEELNKEVSSTWNHKSFLF
jgi:hypothetical protein